MNITIANNLRLSDVPPQLDKILIKNLEFMNPKWLENHRLGRWNRGTPKMLRFYDRLRNGSLWIPRGYTRHLIKLCRQHNIQYEFVDQRRRLPPIALKFRGQLKPFQDKAASRMLEKDFGTLCAPTGSGKTVMALNMMVNRQQPALIIVHTRDLAQQWLERINSFLNIPHSQIGFIGGGKQVLGTEVTVALVQSLYKCADEIASNIGFLIVDECHRCPSRTFTEAVSCFDSQYMLGLSATPWRRDNLSKLIFWHLGDLHYQIDKKQLIASGDVLAVDVVVRKTDFKPYFDPVREYSKMVAELTSNDKRNQLIAADVAVEAASSRGICLVLSDRKKHCEILASLLRFKHNVNSEILTGDLTIEQRRKVIDRLMDGQAKVLVATGQLIGEGFDLNTLSILFLATPIKFSGRVLQYLGRVLRPAPNKMKAKVYDYVDVHVDVLKAAAKVRQRIYKN
ncbi:MAG: DEAD/DEAH box helicase [Desulfobacterales bacterium]|nr:DEAD/DEAH box helicase [Desulfobacterales bacterium]